MALYNLNNIGQQVDKWRLTSHKSTNNQISSSEVARVTYDNGVTAVTPGQLGEGMSFDSNGYWQFPTTGYWRIDMTFAVNIAGTNQSNPYMIGYASGDNGASFCTMTNIYNTGSYETSGTNSWDTATGSYFLRVTDTSLFKLQFQINNLLSGDVVMGASNYDVTSFNFTRIGSA